MSLSTATRRTPADRHSLRSSTASHRVPQSESFAHAQVVFCCRTRSRRLLLCPAFETTWPWLLRTPAKPPATLLNVSTSAGQRIECSCRQATSTRAACEVLSGASQPSASHSHVRLIAAKAMVGRGAALQTEQRDRLEMGGDECQQRWGQQMLGRTMGRVYLCLHRVSRCGGRSDAGKTFDMRTVCSLLCLSLSRLRYA